MREFINSHGKIIAMVCVVVAGLIAFYLLTRTSLPKARENPSYGFYVDETTQDVSVHPVTEIPPLQGKNGQPTVYRAFKFTCDNGKNVQVGYYMKYPPDVQATLATMGDDDARRPKLVETAQLVRLPQAGSPWIKAQSEAGEQITQGPPCASGTLRMVHPER